MAWMHYILAKQEASCEISEGLQLIKIFHFLVGFTCLHNYTYHIANVTVINLTKTSLKWSFHFIYII